MADTKISDLVAATSLADTDLFVIAQEDTANKKVAFPTVRDEVLSDHLNDATDAHDASAISVLDSGANYTATDVEGVLAEIAPQLGGGGGLTVLHDEELGSAGTFDVSSISAAHGALLIVLQGRGSNASAQENVNVRFNNDSGNNYTTQIVTVTGGAIAGGGTSAVAQAHIGYVPAASATAGKAGVIVVEVPNYTGTTFNKYIVGRSSVFLSTFYWTANSGLWASTSAIDRIQVFPTTGNFIAGSRLTIYGIGE